MNHTEKVGRLTELREKLAEEKILAHNMVVGLIQLFEPMDRDFEYLMRFNEKSLDALGRDILKRRKLLAKLKSEVEALEEDLGQ